MNNIPNSPKPEIVLALSRKSIIIENVIPKELCEELISFGNDNVRVGENKYANYFQISFHSCLLSLNHKVHDVLQDAWKTVANQLNVNIDFIEPYELKRYTKDDFFGRHTDNYSSLTIDVDRKLTMSIQLSNDDEYENGELVVLGQKYKLRQGSIICFPSYFPHLVEPITKGTRWSLIGWAWGPSWR